VYVMSYSVEGADVFTTTQYRRAGRSSPFHLYNLVVI